MLDTFLRSWFQRYFVDKLAISLAEFCPANIVTSFTVLFGIMCVLSLYFHFFYAAITCLLASGYLDTLDGAIARFRNKNSAGGIIYDIAANRMIEFLVIFGLYLVDPQFRAIDCIYMFAATTVCFSSFITVGIFIKSATKKGFFYSKGLMERTESFIFFTAMIIWPDYFPELASLFVILMLGTTIMRLYTFLSQYKSLTFGDMQDNSDIRKNSTEKILNSM